MSENTTPETTTKTSLTEKLNKLKPSNLPADKKATVIKRVQITAAFVSGVLATVAAVNLKSYYDSIPKVEVTVEVEETPED